MKKKSLMLILILAFLGCVLIGFSIYFLYQESFVANEKTEKATKELERANKKIENLSQELSIMTKNNSVDENKTIELFGQFSSQNLPVLEIISVDLGEGGAAEGNNKIVQRFMYSHEIRFFILNTGKSALKEVIFSIKDIYNEPKAKRKTKKSKVEYDSFGRPINNEEIGSYYNIEVNTLNLKSKKMIYSSNLPSSFGIGEYSFDVILEWDKGSYQMKVDIEETDGKLNFKYEFYNLNGKPIDLKKLTNLVSK